MTYLVMECHPSYVIVLDNEGRMIKAANLGYQEGQVVGEIIARQAPKVPVLIRLAPLATAACLCLAVLGGGAYGAYGMPYGTVEVRINPDVKMSVSYMDRVVGLEGVNEDGKKLIDQVPYKGRNSEYMTEILVERAMEMGYLSEGGTVYVAASGGSERWKEKRADAIRTGLDTLLKDSMPVEVHVESIGKDGTPAAVPHHGGGLPGGAGGDKPAFIGVPPGGTSEEMDDDNDDDREDDRDGDSEDDRENDGKEGRGKSGRNKAVNQMGHADDDKDEDHSDGSDRDGDNGEKDSDDEGSDKEDTDKEDTGGKDTGEGDKADDDSDDDSDDDDSEDDDSEDNDSDDDDSDNDDSDDGDSGHEDTDDDDNDD